MVTYQKLIEKQRQFFLTDQTKQISFRMDALTNLRNGIKSYEKTLMDALNSDLNKSEFEAYSTEIGVVLEEIRFTAKNLASWAKPEKVRTPLTHLGSKSYIYSEPYGIALIIAPWNYPFQLALAPLIGAIAAGNCAVLKPSELTPKTSEVITTLIKNIFPEEYIAVVQGGVETSQALLQEKVDYIFFTGSVSVGKTIMEAAAKNLTPVTLELGGKSPCIVHSDADLRLAAKRIAWGKFTNAGQTCIAPDYLYVQEEIKEDFLNYLKDAIKELYGPSPLQNPYYTHIVNEKHFKRLYSLLNNGDIFFGGKTTAKDFVIEPTILHHISWDDPIMKDEIFGPILPVFQYESMDGVIEEIQHHAKPLSLYLFTNNEQVERKVLDSISFGGGCINDTLYHFVSPYLPFGGVGTSGIGAYHGKGSFDTFSHKKSILKQTIKFDIPFSYPNVRNGLRKLKFFLK